MLKQVLALPLMVILIGIAALAMFLPAAHAGLIGDQAIMRIFLYSGGIFLVFTGLLGLATANHKSRHPGRSHLLAVLATFAGLPLMLAVPLRIAVPDTSFFNAYVEMVSAITTTGAYMFDDPARLDPSLHLWRAFVAWLGGFFVLVTAVAILAPMNLGGFDVLSSGGTRTRRTAVSEDFWAADGGHRLVRFSTRLLPAYVLFTLALWVLLMVRNEDALQTLIVAMSTLSTSGITGPETFVSTEIGIGGEMTVLVFLLLALSRLPFSTDRWPQIRGQITTDPELRLGLIFVIAVPLLLFLRHWVGALEVDEQANFVAAIRSLWGGIFTVLSFLTTTGFESVAWVEARDWSGLATPGIVLLGLALIGGGVATTAGGVKLLRVYALYVHGVREMQRVILPSSVGGSGAMARRLRREGAYLAWIFFMLFALTITALVLAFAAAGQTLEEAITLAVAGLSTTGPVAAVTLSEPISYAGLSPPAKAVLVAAMVLGRLEMLVIIALFNPNLWRR